MHSEFVERAQANYERWEERVEEAREKKLAMEERVREARENLPRLHAGALSLNQKRILVSIEKFMPDKNKTSDQNKDRNLLVSELKNSVLRLRGKVKKS